MINMLRLEAQQKSHTVAMEDFVHPIDKERLMIRTSKKKNLSKGKLLISNGIKIMKNFQNIVRSDEHWVQSKWHDDGIRCEPCKDSVVIIVVNFCSHTENPLQMFTIPYLSQWTWELTHPQKKKKKFLGLRSGKLEAYSMGMDVLSTCIETSNPRKGTKTV